MPMKSANKRVIIFFDKLGLNTPGDEGAFELGKFMVAFSFMTLIFRLKEITYRPGTQIPESFIKGISWGASHATLGFWTFLALSLIGLAIWIFWQTRRETDRLLPALGTAFLLTWSYPMNLAWALGSFRVPDSIETLPTLILVGGWPFKAAVLVSGMSLALSLIRRQIADSVLVMIWLAIIFGFRGNDLGLVFILATTLVRMRYLFWTGLVAAPVAIPEFSQYAFLALLAQPGIQIIFRSPNFFHPNRHSQTG